MKRVAIIEDNIFFIEAMKGALKEAGFSVILEIVPKTGDSAEEIVKMVTEVSPNLILLDHRFCHCLPGKDCDCVNGHKIFKRLGRELQDRVISISGGSMNGYVPDRPTQRKFCSKDFLSDQKTRQEFKTLVQKFADLLPPTAQTPTATQPSAQK